MFYDFTLTIPAGTPAEAPEELELQLSHGIVHTVRLDFPPGPRGEVSIIICDALHQVFPTNEGGVFNADNTYINFNDYYDLTRAPYLLTAKGWSPDADYDHTIHIEIGVLESKMAMAALRVAAALESFISFFSVKV
jgi:hypothetical protein